MKLNSPKQIVRDMLTFSTIRFGKIAVLSLATVFLAACERPPMNAEQGGYRGTGMEQIHNPRTDAANASKHIAPESPPAASADGPKAKDVYQNVKVLGDLSVGEFTRHMVSITQWVAPEQGCAYCHNVQNFADDGKYTKIVARRMVQMTQNINVNWQKHVGNTGVTCYTCHRGNPNPKQVWQTALAANKIFMGNDNGQNKPSPTVGLSSLPYDPFTPYLLKAEAIRVNGTQALPHGNPQNIKNAETTYGLMMHFSGGLGVNCTYCHNAQNFAGWENNPPQKMTAWYGIRMVRDVNNEYITPLTSTFPVDHLGPAGDIAKVNCATCHQGANKPLNGKSMIGAHPELAKLAVAYTPATPVAPAPVANVSPPTGVLGKILFDTAKTGINDVGAKEIATVVDAMKLNPALKVDISGFADSRGAVEQNMQLSKLRAFAVRDALTGSGIAADRINLRKPEMAVVGGAEADSRRVEIISAK